ncbi:BTAD domain-containing putative transcriptional regulator [Nonomuraea sp. H19]|uniref:BTAD domain-containing putative transcriptional regulator n=1 Tax=Nonomuraea sp. H19 TaxID=3452206 RepID=UPI003F8C3CDC
MDGSGRGRPQPPTLISRPRRRCGATRSPPSLSRGLVGHADASSGRSGRRAEALNACRRMHAILSEELGVEPADDVRRLHQDILHGVVGRRHPAKGRRQRVTRRQRAARMKLISIITTSTTGFTRDRRLLGRGDTT